MTAADRKVSGCVYTLCAVRKHTETWRYFVDRLTESFTLNSAFVFEDKLPLTCTYKDETKTLQEMESFLGSNVTGMCLS